MLRHLLIMLLAVIAQPCIATTVEKLVITVGQSERVSITPSTQVMIANESLAQAKLVSQDTLLVRGLMPGTTDMWLIGPDDRRVVITVLHTVPTNVLARLKAWQRDYQSFSIKRQGQQIELAGALPESKRATLKKLIEPYPNIIDRTTSTQVEHPMLRLKVTILEIKQQFVQQLGIQWDSQIAGPNWQLGRQGGVEWSPLLMSNIQLLEQQGAAKLLATPVLTTQSGQPASFLAGGEIPIPQVVGQGMQDVSFREYGVRLTIDPVVAAENKITAKLSAEVSNIDPAVEVNGVPGILTRRTEAVLSAQHGETVVLSGLLSTDSSESEAGLPGLKQLPIAGEVFKQRGQRNQHTELLIFVTSEIVAYDHQRQALKQRYREQAQQWYLQAGCIGLKE
ncbi:pilus assembly protein N-terminal domain-containing protein [Idiomarina sp. MD25a]|uniref:type II and III secretion system protein family protein n=1 Tax=Idiomarina sp. MD25a TaxID=1889913 RepID=UPI0009F4CB93|nr:pilus assembly protein N-terminal domain-containing protein [Idiomarina sp. MD25a]